MGRGSPPRVRGTGCKKRTRSLSVRITPACAGNSFTLVLFAPCRADHPRVRGEQVSLLWFAFCGLGSPPRVRGTVLFPLKLLRKIRITPACAGNSTPMTQRALTAQDHPRVCGEQMGSMACSRPRPGSPPRVRGTGCFRKQQSQCKRITPACAGNREPLYLIRQKK